jgi:hypothetical protein
VEKSEKRIVYQFCATLKIWLLNVKPPHRLSSNGSRGAFLFNPTPIGNHLPDSATPLNRVNKGGQRDREIIREIQ